jgi:hypothetical protein
VTEGLVVSFFVKSRVGPDGSLRVAIPTGLAESDVEVLIVVQPVLDQRNGALATNSWPERYFETTFGCQAEDPLTREPKLQLEPREKLL